MSSADDDMDPLYRAVGSIVVQWGQAEQTLEMIVAMLYHSYGGKKHAKRIPQPLSRKIMFVRRCLENKELKPHVVAMERLLLDFEKLSTKRHDLIHGAISSVTADDGIYRFAKLDLKDGFHHAREFEFDIREFPGFYDELIKLGRDSIEVANKLIGKLREEA